MKKCLILIVLFCGVQYLSSQVFKFRAHSISIYNNKLDNWKPFEETHLLISVNLDKSRVSIYSKEVQIFDIIKIDDQTTDKNGDILFKFHIEDAKGEICNLDYVEVKNGTKLLYIRYPTLQYVYAIEQVE